uniref:Uncharacterized protein n=1 Tax=Romanomermis culicivorax TaxID=13658 RepID=A0A915L7I6_ROMCU
MFMKLERKVFYQSGLQGNILGDSITSHPTYDSVLKKSLGYSSCAPRAQNAPLNHNLEGNRLVK